MKPPSPGFAQECLYLLASFRQTRVNPKGRKRRGELAAGKLCEVRKGSMTASNEQTLRTYDAHVTDYVAGTAQVVSGPSKDWIDAALRGLPPDARILELGSAFGRDAAYIQQRGFRVECTDASQGFLDYLRDEGFDVRLFNALTDTLTEDYDLILANAVLLHFNRDEFQTVLGKMAGALKPGGRFAFSLKRGDGEDWSTMKLNAPRYFCYWQPEQLPPLIQMAGFEHWDVSSVETQRRHAEWIYAIAKV